MDARIATLEALAARHDRWLLAITALILAQHPWAVSLLNHAMALAPELTTAGVTLGGIFLSLFVVRGMP